MLTEKRPFRGKGQKLLFFSRQPLGCALKGCWIAAEYYYQGIEKPLGNAQRLLESLWAILKGYWKAAGKCPNICRLLANRRAGRIAQWLLAKMQQYPFISSELLCFCLYLLKVGEAMENFKNAQRIFSYFFSFQPYHLQPDSNWCDSPFKEQCWGIRKIYRPDVVNGPASGTIVCWYYMSSCTWCLTGTSTADSWLEAKN